MTELLNGNVEKTESANPTIAGPKLRFLAVFFPVLATISVIATIAMPILRDQQIKVNEAAAIMHIYKIIGSQTGYSGSGGLFADSFAQLTDSTHGFSFLSGEWYDGVQKDGYTFTMKGVGLQQNLHGTVAECYEITAFPAVPGLTGKRYFFCDCSVVFRGNVGAPADSTSPPIPEMNGIIAQWGRSHGPPYQQPRAFAGLRTFWHSLWCKE